MGPLAHSYAAESDRTIPSLLWALLAVVIVGSNSLAGVIALTLYSVGYLAKFFSETFESTDLSSQKHLHPWVLGPSRHFNMGFGPMPGPSSGAIVYGCWSTMYARLALLDMWVREVSVYTSNSMLNLPIVGINFHSFYCAS